MCDNIGCLNCIDVPDVGCISDSLIGQPYGEMQVIEDEWANDGLIEVNLDDTDVDDVEWILILMFSLMR